MLKEQKIFPRRIKWGRWLAGGQVVLNVFFLQLFFKLDNFLPFIIWWFKHLADLTFVHMWPGISLTADFEHRTVSLLCRGGYRGPRLRCLNLSSTHIIEQPFPFNLLPYRTCGRRSFNRGSSRWYALCRRHRTISARQRRILVDKRRWRIICPTLCRTFITRAYDWRRYLEFH